MQFSRTIILAAARTGQLALLVILTLATGAALQKPGVLTAAPKPSIQALANHVPDLPLSDCQTLLAIAAGLFVVLAVWIATNSTVQAHFGLSGPGLMPQINRAVHLLALLFVGIAIASSLAILGLQSAAPATLLLILRLYLWSAIAGLAAYTLSILLSAFSTRARPAVRDATSPFLLLGAALLGLVTALAAHHLITRPIELTTMHSANRINVDGTAHPFEWSRAESQSFTIWGGEGFLGGATRVSISALRVRQRVSLLVQWDDPTESLNRYLIKSAPYRWRELDQVVGGENQPGFWEDQLVLVISQHPIPEQLPQLDLPGLAQPLNDTLDTWRWMAVSTNPSGQADDHWIGPDSASTLGLQPDPRTGGGATSNLNQEWQQPYLMDWGPSHNAWINVDSRFVKPYWPVEDTLKIGSLVPGVIIGQMAGDGADVQAFGRYARGSWTVELSRAVRTGSPLDSPLDTTFYVTVYLADNNPSSFSRPLRHIRVSAPQ